MALMLYETNTDLTPAEVIKRARSFFALAGTPYAAFPEVVTDSYVKFHMEVGEILIATRREEDSTWVGGTASRGGHLLSRFLIGLGDPLDVTQTRRAS